MNKKGIALVFSFIIVMVLTILLGSLFLKTMNENSLVRRHVDSTSALWLAEAGLSEAVRNIGSASGSGFLPLNQASHSWNYITTFWKQIGINNYYNITANGTVLLAGGGQIRRRIQAVARTTAANPDLFTDSLASNGNLCFKQCDDADKDANRFVFSQPDPNLLGIDPDLYPLETQCPGATGNCEDDNNLSLSIKNLLGYQFPELEALADHVYTTDTVPDNIHGVTYIKIVDGKIKMNGGGSGGSYQYPNGTGLLIIDGNVDQMTVNGNYFFKGIIFVNGYLKARGTFSSYGSVLVQVSAGLEDGGTVNGTPNFFHSKFDIKKALEELEDNSAVIVSWKEITP